MTFTESDLILPSLRFFLANRKDGVSTSDLQKHLRARLRPKGEDLEPLEARADDKFSQKVRNLKSHDTFERDDLAEYRHGRYYITERGERFLNDVEGVDDLYQQQGFPEVQKKAALRPTNRLIFIEEGGEANLNVKVRLRSRILRRFALRHFSAKDGTIICVGCGFEGTRVYGERGLGLIEIHHLSPIAVRTKSIRTAIRTALENVVPLCPNCHRLVHRQKDGLLSIDSLTLTTGYVASAAANRSPGSRPT